MYQWLEGRSWRSIVETARAATRTLSPSSRSATEEIWRRAAPQLRREKLRVAPDGGRYQNQRWASRAKSRPGYVAWMDHCWMPSTGAAPVAEERRDNSKMDERDLDSSDAINLLSAAAGLSGVEWADMRDKADGHLRWLRQSARDRFFRAFGEYHTRLHDQSDVVANSAVACSSSGDAAATAGGP